MCVCVCMFSIYWNPYMKLKVIYTQIAHATLTKCNRYAHKALELASVIDI